MVILAIDLAWVGASGWVVWDTEDEYDPVKVYGSFKPKAKKSWTPAMRDFGIAAQISEDIQYLIETYQPGFVVYEITDWFRNLRRSKRFEVDYKIERVNQRALGKAGIACLMGLSQAGYPMNQVNALGANEAKDKFGARNKRGAAELFASEFDSRFIPTPENDKHFIYDGILETPVSDHVTDAFVLAFVTARDLQFQEVLKNAT